MRLRGGGEQVRVYTYSVEQVIEVKAGSEEEARELLPLYPTGFEGQAYYVSDETVELLREGESA
jgi:hypothetical protein